ncbi:MAG: urate oxidase [Chloroflexi bacterium]|nr:MAG: urate oxidase [Chloroflexota bacterium]
MSYEISYGKADVKVYRTHATPLTGIAPIPESPFTGRDNRLFAAELEIVVRGEAFIAAYTRGDNRRVVATDTMKNFILQAALNCEAATLEGWLHEIGRAFLLTYPQMERLTMRGRELPFPAALVPDRQGFMLSERLFSRDRNDASHASLDLERAAGGDAVEVTSLEAGREGLQLIKLTGSSFADFARDAHTTLPDRPDRPLYIWVDIDWRYTDPMRPLDPVHPGYVAGEQVADLAASVFHDFVSLSIQHLVHEIGERMLARWPQLAEVRFEAQNRLWDTAAVSEADPQVRVYCDPPPPYGRIGLVMRRGERATQR